MSAQETYSLAHTARCKLQLAADRPDRNLRFILGHAFTLDKIRLRIAEIETDSSSDEEDMDSMEAREPPRRERRVSFNSNKPAPQSTERKRSPPPTNRLPDAEAIEDDEDDDIEEDDEEDDSLSLRRFESGSAKPPQMIEDESSSSDEEEPDTPPLRPSDDELKLICEGEADEELMGMYKKVAGCPCHGGVAPGVDNVWEIPRKMGQEGPRIAVVQVSA